MTAPELMPTVPPEALIGPQQQQQPQIDDEPGSAEEAAQEAQQIRQSLMVINQQVQQLGARLLFLDGWQRGNANRENRRAATAATKAEKAAKKATKR